jgi:hypothetical protein
MSTQETVTLMGVKADGTQVTLGEVQMPPRMKAKEIIRGYFDGGFEDDSSEASMALAVVDELLDWMKEQNMIKPLDLTPKTGA